MGSSGGSGGGSGTPLAQTPLLYLSPTGAIAETFPRPVSGNIAAALTTQNLNLVPIQLAVNTKVSNITFSLNSTSLGTPTNWWFGLYDNNRNQLALTADQLTAAWAAPSTKTLAIATVASGSASSFTTTYTGLHYVGIMLKATIVGSYDTLPGGNANLWGLAPKMAGTSDTTQTTPPSFPHQATAITVVNTAFLYCYLS